MIIPLVCYDLYYHVAEWRNNLIPSYLSRSDKRKLRRMIGFFRRSYAWIYGSDLCFPVPDACDAIECMHAKARWFDFVSDGEPYLY